MTRQFCIGPLSALALPPPRLLQSAARAGADGVGVRLRAATPGGIAYRLMDDPAMLRETLAVKAATGLRILDIELVRLDPAFAIGDYAAFFATAAALGAAHVLVVADDPVEARTVAAFAQVCEALQPYGLTADLEFVPWMAVRDLATAKRIVGAAAQPNGGILVDALHFARAGCQLHELDDVPDARLHYAQICDGPLVSPETKEGLIHAARCERALPGEGGLDLHGLFSRLPAQAPICIETPSDTRAPRVGWDEWLRLAVSASRQVVGSLGGRVTPADTPAPPSGGASP